ncbi:MAG TPA: hypothetical protein VMJ34_18735 [Bryobacteraceae bacterium]|nr:hypothetical protein [Bryobacteraceae bacterium]
MRAALWMGMMAVAVPLLAGQRMNVSVCVQGHRSQKAVTKAEIQVARLFRSMDIEIVWSGCDAGPIGEEAARSHWYTIRLRDGLPVGTPDSASLDTLGQAFFTDNGTSYLAEIYYEASDALALRKQIEPEALLGCVMAHELGHLLLGPGHAPSGIMRSGWSSHDLDSIRAGWLKFSPDESVRIRQRLQDSDSPDPAAS